MPTAFLMCGGILLLAGCQLHDPASTQRAPAVSTRFTMNPLSDSRSKSERRLNASTVPGLKLGLAMQSGIDPVHSQFASRLGTVLVRELQLSEGSLAVEPLTTLQVPTAIPSLETEQPSGDVITVAFADAQDTLPPQLPPNPMLMAQAVPIVDQILVVRVIEYRPYFPLLTTLEIRVLDGDTQDPVFATTATWSGVDYRLANNTPKRSLRQKFFCNEPTCGPSPGHNSPQALMHEIALDISDWYNHSLASAVSRTSVKKASLRDRWMSPFRKDTCPPCDPSLSGLSTPNLTTSDPVIR